MKLILGFAHAPGRSGSICKHLVGVHLHTDAALFSFPLVSLEDRNRYHLIAFGKPPPKDHYVACSNKKKIQVTSYMPQSKPIDATLVSPHTQISLTVSDPDAVNQASYNNYFEDMANKHFQSIQLNLKAYGQDPEFRDRFENFLVNIDKKSRASKSSFVNYIFGFDKSGGKIQGEDVQSRELMLHPQESLEEGQV